MESKRSLFYRALAVEAGLLVVTAAVGFGTWWRFGWFPLSTFSWCLRDFGLGLAAALPLLAIFLPMSRFPWQPFRRLRNLEAGVLWRILDRRKNAVFPIFFLSLTAGIGEEALFRGLFQGGITDGLTAWLGGTAAVGIALTVSSILFGLGHAASRLYVTLAAGIGLYLGGLFAVTDNLLVPITTHATYDFIAMIFLLFDKTAQTDYNS